ncbi:OsmC family peroxiredoxin [Nannocystis pusilla]|uniref:OsmC family peroxiredoxin n=1 Tax=Nannocystis pusilla TaxID=889268 RepID=UPI003B82C29E
MGISKASAQWEGSIKTGKGSMKPEHAPEIPFSFASRFEGQPASNPEEVVGAALAGCFSMALSLGLEKAGTPPRSIHTSAAVKLEKDGEGFSITTIELTTEADVPGLDADKFTAIAEATKKACPVSKALAGVRTISLKASLRSAAQ